MLLPARQTYLLLFSLYWAQGLPVGFMTHALPVILRSQGVSLAHIGGFGVLMAPWALKVFWAPYLDRYGHQNIESYRYWALVTQALTVVVLVILSFFPIHVLDQPVYLVIFFIFLLLMNILGATQDIATDALAVNLLKPKQQHWGNFFQVVGSRLGFIVGGGVILWLMDLLYWQGTFILLAILVAINRLPIWKTQLGASVKFLKVKQSQSDFSHSTSLKQQFKNYFRYFTKNKELRIWLVVLITIKVTDGLSGAILKPLMVDIGLSFSQIGIYVTMLGAMAALLGAAFASYLLKYLSRSYALLFFTLLKLASLAVFAFIARCYEQGYIITTWWIYLANALEDMFAAMQLLIMLTLVMQYSRQQYAGTDFSFQVSVMAFVSGALYSLSGLFAERLGYSDYLFCVLVLGGVLLWPIISWIKKATPKYSDVD
ncbi:MFS transporter [Acinetobacter rudis]|uniref:MFS transporter n=1 Tax=Acinetobacter rudis TaxID=632955 RepID=UPI00280F6744|nr:MFS transporter [Acinetobacter rudis]MDQ8953218.1 MFS transporter [Acinetobacter rudis]